jgi:hypothetical protein
MGWSGDISVFSRTAVNMADIDEFLRKHMQAIRDVQTADGRFPDIAPIGGGFGGLLWGSAGITVPWECWLQYGDLGILASHYEAMVRYIDYVDSHYFAPTTRLLVQQKQWGDLGDWLGLEDEKNDKTLLFEAYYIYDLDIMRQTALLLGKYDDAERYALESYGFPHRVLSVGEKFLYYGLSDDAHLGRFLDVFFGEEGSFLNLPEPNSEVVRAFAVAGAGGVVGTEDGLSACANFW